MLSKSDIAQTCRVERVLVIEGNHGIKLMFFKNKIFYNSISGVLILCEHGGFSQSRSHMKTLT